MKHLCGFFIALHNLHFTETKQRGEMQVYVYCGTFVYHLNKYFYLQQHSIYRAAWNFPMLKARFSYDDDALEIFNICANIFIQEHKKVRL